MSFPRNHFARSLRHTPRKPWKPLQGLLGACRWLVARVPRGLTWAGLAALGWLAVAVGVMAWLVWPLQVGWFAVGAALSAAVCLPLRSRRLAAVEAVEQRFDAYRLADARTDLDTVGPVTAQQVLREPADGEAIEVEPWQHAGERAITERCESCRAPGNVRLADGSVWCWECDGSARRLGYDDDAWQPVAEVYRTGDVVQGGMQVVLSRSAESTGPAWVDCWRCDGRKGFDAQPAEGLPWMPCPACNGTGGQWRQP